MAKARQAGQLYFNFEVDPEDRALIERIQAGDKPAFEVLLAKHRGLVWRYIRRYCRKIEAHRRDELEQAAILGLWESARHFDFSRNTKFSTYAVEWLKQSVLRNMFWQNANAKHLRTVSLSASSDDDQRGIELVAAETEPEQAAQRREEKEQIERRMRQALLSERERQAVNMKLSGATLDKVGQALRCTKERARQIIVKAKAKLERRTADSGHPRLSLLAKPFGYWVCRAFR